MRHRCIQKTVCALIISLFLFCCVMACQAEQFRSGDERLGPGRHTLTITVDGLTRTYIVHVPPSYDSKTQSPLVVMLHGGGGTAKAAIWETGWTEKADRAGFIASSRVTLGPLRIRVLQNKALQRTHNRDRIIVTLNR